MIESEYRTGQLTGRGLYTSLEGHGRYRNIVQTVLGIELMGKNLCRSDAFITSVHAQP